MSTDIFSGGHSLYSAGADAKCLSPAELGAVKNSLITWEAEAKTAQHKLSRRRILLSFLLIRYAGLRLNELLTLNDKTDFLPVNCSIQVTGVHARRVPLPPQVFAEIMRSLEDPMFYHLRGSVFNIDQGYLRRKFYELATRSELAKNMLNPRILRYSRAAELLQAGLPTRVVDAFLGQQMLGFDASLMEFSQDTAGVILEDYLSRELALRTSARNVFTGKISQITQDAFMVYVTLECSGGVQVRAVITEDSCAKLNLAEGRLVCASIKATLVNAAAYYEGEGHCANDFSGTVSGLASSSIMAEIKVTLDNGNAMCAIITREHAEALALEVGVRVRMQFKALAVVLHKAN